MVALFDVDVAEKTTQRGEEEEEMADGKGSGRRTTQTPNPKQSGPVHGKVQVNANVKKRQTHKNVDWQC